MARYDAFPNPEGRGWLLDVQADLLRDLNTRVVALQHVAGQPEIARRAREGPNVVEAVDEGEGPAARQRAIGGLQAEDAAERRRHPERAVCVRAERDRREARRRRGAAARGGAAAHPPGVVGIAAAPSWAFSPVKS